MIRLVPEDTEKSNKFWVDWGRIQHLFSRLGRIT